jgi:hypothetical protein
MTWPQFKRKWSRYTGKESSAYQEHFNDLCQLLGQPTPAEADPTGSESFCFQKRVVKDAELLLLKEDTADYGKEGDRGFADVWKKDCFAWEYKGKKKNLDEAYRQLLRYRESLLNPPLLVVCDFDRYIVRTNFNGAVQETHEFTNANIDAPENLRILRSLFINPEGLRPVHTASKVTEDLAKQIAAVARSLQDREAVEFANARTRAQVNVAQKKKLRIARFLNRIIFCLFAEDIGLLPDGIFSDLAKQGVDDPVFFAERLEALFRVMAKGGNFGTQKIRYFNGHLFEDSTVFELTPDEIRQLAEASESRWESIEPKIMGTLFERALDPDHRAQLGAHYTSEEDIKTLVEPVLMQPLRREWKEIKRDLIRSYANPPFLGGKLLRRELGGAYVDALFENFGKRVRPEADFCCYWFEKAREEIERKKCHRAGLLGTQGIRGGANRETIHRIKAGGDIFFAESDRPWILDGANVHVSMVGFDNGSEKRRVLDGKTVTTINANLTATADVTQVAQLAPNLNIAFMGTTKGGAFDITETQALEFLRAPNPHGKPNSDVVVPWVNGMDLTKRSSDTWIIDFGVGMPERDAAQYEKVFEFVKDVIKPIRDNNARESYRRLWWQHVEARPALRNALSPLPRFIVTIAVAKHRLFVWMKAPSEPDHAVFAFARDDDYFFGVLHSRFHEVWALKQGTRLETRPRYTPTTCFETFPLPQPTPEQQVAIGAPAKELNELRERWLNPPEWTVETVLEFCGSVNGPWARFLVKPDKNGIGTVRYPRLQPKDADCAKKLEDRTLTKLYNERPTWLDLAHKKLDAAVAAAYGFPADLTDDQILERLLKLNLERAAAELKAGQTKKPKTSRDKHEDEMI